MKIDTIKLTNKLFLDEITRFLADVDGITDESAIRSADCRNVASSCEQVMKLADALRDINLTAAVEAERIEIAASEMKSDFINGRAAGPLDLNDIRRIQKEVSE